MGPPFVILIYKGTADLTQDSGKATVEELGRRLIALGYVVKPINGAHIPELDLIALEAFAVRALDGGQ